VPTSRDRFDGVTTYARTKRAQVVLAELLAARAPDIAVSSMHPGWADTPGVSTSLPIFHALTRPILRTAAEGADTVVWLALARAAAQPAGRFYFDREPATTHLRAATREPASERARLWSELCRLIGADPDNDFR
jgi:NAD(P)-dependent dehydrogenase (short-subunit alcohol dehydrogenase family)